MKSLISELTLAQLLLNERRNTYHGRHLSASTTLLHTGNHKTQKHL